MKIYKRLISLALLAPIVLSKPVIAKGEYTNLIKNTEVLLGPEDDYEVIGTLDSSDNIKIISEAINDYYLIKSDNISGFVSSNSLSDSDKEEYYMISNTLDTKEVVEAQVNVNIREDASVESKKIGLLWGSEKVDLISSENPDWYQVNYYGQIGYVSSKYVKTITTWDIPNNAYKIGYIKENIYLNDQFDNPVLMHPKNEVGYIINEPSVGKYTMLTNNGLLTIEDEAVEEVDLNRHDYPEKVEKVLIRIRHENEMKENNK